MPVAILALLGSAHLICPSRAALTGPVAAWPAGSPCVASGAMRRRTITIAEPQHRHCSLGRSLKGGCTDDGCAEGCMPDVQSAIALGLSPMRNSVSRWRCLQLGCAKRKLRERRNPLGLDVLQHQPQKVRCADGSRRVLAGATVTKAERDLAILAAQDVTLLNHPPVQVAAQIDQCFLAIARALAFRPPSARAGTAAPSGLGRSRPPAACRYKVAAPTQK